jgi:putative heme-binding domain-containing protein
MRATFLVVLFAVVLATSAAAQDSSSLRALFDGRSLDGWRGDPAIWSVEDGVIVGSTHGVKLRANTFLIHEDEFGDFELRCSVKLEGNNNSGVQYRSRVLKKGAFRVHGYQCDWHPKPEYSAMLYGEGAGGIVAQRGQFIRWTDQGRQELGRLVKPVAVDVGAWHELRIVARGDLVWHELNGRIVTALQDQRASAPRSGIVALQAHAGAAMKVSFRNLSVRSLAKPDDVAMPRALLALLRRADESVVEKKTLTPNWVWDQEAQAEEELFFRREFAVAEVPETAQLSVSCDNHCRVYVNGQRVANDDSWESPTLVDVAKHLQVGANCVAVHGWNDGGPAGMALRVAWQEQGKDREVVTDGAWRCLDDDPDGWDSSGFDASAWQAVKVLGEMGQSGLAWSSRHGAAALGQQTNAYAPQVAIVDWEIDRSDRTQPQPMRLLDVPRELGSWVSLASDPQGRLYSSAQGGGLYRITPADQLGDTTTIERVPVDLGGAHGLLWFRDCLYAVVNGGQDGLYRLTDTNNDDMLDRVELLRALDGSGEHGPHSVVVAPDGENLLVLCGNMTKLTELAGSRVPINWQEERLVPRIEDARGFWGGYSPPGGCLYKVDPDGKDWELICCGFRNPFDLVVLPSGQVVVYDADMEWDMGLPWYRPTRYLAGQSGVDYGWRKGSAKWAVDYPEAPQALQDIGPGSPTGMAYVPGTDGGIIGLDWTFGTAYFEGKPWSFGAPFPVADVTFAKGKGGGVFVVTGGRGLPSRLVRLVPGRDSSEYEWSDAEENRVAGWGAAVAWSETETRTAQQILDAGAVGGDRLAFRGQSLESKADWVTARIALERLPADSIRGTVLAVHSAQPGRSFAGLLALARQGTAADLQPILDALGKFSFASMSHMHRIAWLRIHAVALLRQGPVSDAQRTAVANRLLPLFPSENERQDQDLCELLAYVDAPGLLDKAVPLLTPLKPSQPPEWAELATRNARYGGVIDKMMANMTPMGQLAIANALRMVDHDWTIAQRRALFTFLGEARGRSGGASYDGYVLKIVDLAWQTCSDDEKRELEFLVGHVRAPKNKFNSKPPKGPGKRWQMSDIAELVDGGFAGRKRKSGRNLFHAAGCASCHYFQGEGGFGGPDLTSLKNKFRAEDLLEAVIDPNKVISDQYTGQVLTKKDGTALFGVVHKTWDGDMEVYEVIPAVADATPVRIPVEEVEKVAPSPQSPMPAGLLDRLSKNEVRDLVAFLIGSKDK